MRIISFIEDEENIKKILKHLNLWEVQNHDPPENYRIPPEYEYLIKMNIVAFGNKDSTNIENSKTYSKNNFEKYNDDFDSFPDYDICDPLPKYEDLY